MAKRPQISDLINKADLALSDLLNGKPKPPELGLTLRRIGKRHRAKTRRPPRRFERWHIIAADTGTDSFCLRNEGNGKTEWFTRRQLQSKSWSGLEGNGGWLSEKQVEDFLKIAVGNSPLLNHVKVTNIEHRPETQQIVVGIVLEPIMPVESIVLTMTNVKVEE